ncbi:HOOK domain containing protein [Trichuris trichiura]|uniref:HOOK domain containing protein n=1 Tax=Trichuris trichiura TaxID=36087 RepID=A0A077ZEY9_TRITR|nr:HOOK domain containing protein [Trichuris trichiura]
MDMEDVFQCLCKWIAFVKQSPSPVSLDSLVTGHAFAEVLHIIDPSYFDENWRDSIKAAVNSSSYWRIKAFALRRLMKALLKYNAEVCNNPVTGRIIPDVTLIARDNSLPELVKFMQLLVASAVHGPKGKEMIEAILTLEESIQQTIMLSIKELETSKGKCEPITPDEEVGPATASRFRQQYERVFKFSQKQVMFEELNDALQSHENIAAHCVHLETQLADCTAEKQSLLSKIASLTQQLQASSLSFEELKKESSAKAAQLSATVKTLEMEMAKSENSRDMLSYELEQLQKELWDYQMRGASKSEDQSRKAKDEIDELRAKAADADTLSEQVVTLKKKLEVVGDLRSEIKVLEEKNASLVAQLVQSEEEQRKSAGRKVQLETLKMKLQQAESKAEEEARKGVQFELELRKLTEKEAEMTQERDRLMQERKTLQDNVDELQCLLLETANSSGVAQNSLDVASPGADMDTVMALVADAPVEIKQKLLRLYQENRLLRSRLTSEKESTSDNEISQNILADERLTPASNVATRSTTVLSDETEVEMLRSQVEKLTTELESKDEQIKQDKKAYYDNLEKARQVIYALNTAVKCGADTNYTISDIEAMKASIAQKERMIEDLQESLNRTKIMYEQEERLITTAFHELVSSNAWQLHRKAGEERMAIAFGEEPPTFLNQQRQLSMTKPKAAGDTYANHNYSLTFYGTPPPT